MAAASDVCTKWRLRLQERIGPAFEDVAVEIDRQVSALGVDHRFDILTLLALADFEGQPQEVDVAVGSDLADKGYAAGR